MKFRLGLVLMGFLTLLLLKLISVSFTLINLSSDMAVLIGCLSLGIIISIGPWLYRIIYRKFMKKPINNTMETNNEV